MYGSEFDGNAAFSGGGFMPSQATQTADPSFSPAKVTLVGVVFNKAERVTDVSFVIDDGTGRIDCNRWVNEAVDTKEMEVISNGMYLRVHGHLKGFQGKRQLVVFSTRPVTDYNEIVYHFAECIYVHVHNTRLQKLQGAAPSSAPVPNSAVSTPSNGYQAAPSNHIAAQYGIDGLKAVDKMIIEYLQQPPCLAREKGVHRNELAQQLNVPLEKIVQSLECLESEGLVYSTIDECHYRSTANG